MIFALDYDGTYTEAKALWDLFIEAAKNQGHKVVIVTMRFPDEEVSVKDADTIYTGRKAKKLYCDEKGHNIDIWIDDNPHWLFQDSM